MKRHPTSEFYLSIDRGDPLDLPDHDWPDAPLPYHYGEPGRAEGVLSLACAIGGVSVFGLVAFAANWAVQ